MLGVRGGLACNDRSTNAAIAMSLSQTQGVRHVHIGPLHTFLVCLISLCFGGFLTEYTNTSCVFLDL